MSTPFQFDLVSPEEILMSEQITSVVIPGSDGDFGVLFDHAPLLSSLRPGVVRIQTESGDKMEIFVTGGFADVNDNLCTVLAEEAVNTDKIDAAALDAEISGLQKSLEKSDDDAQNAQHLTRRLAVAEAKKAAIA